MNSVQDQVYEIVSSTLDVKRADIRPASTWEDCKADSLEVVELVLALEDHFNISFDTPELKNIKSIADLVEAVQAKLQTIRAKL